MRPSNSSSTVPVAEWITPRLLDRDPYGVLGQLRESAPVHWVPAIDRYVITRFDDCRYVETHPEVFTAEQPGHRVDRTIGRSMIRKDDPAHARERHAANHSLRVKAIADKWRPVFETNTDRLITEFIDRGSGADLSRDLAAPLAATNVAALVGLSHIPHEDVTRWSAAFMAGAANLAEEPDIWARVAAVNAEIDDAVDEATPHLRRHPDGSILSAMIEADMPVETQRANVKLAISGGINEPKHALTNAVWALSTHTEQRRAAMAEPSLFESVFEEIVRRLPPVGLISRRTTLDVELEGWIIPAGAQVGASLHAANRDPRRFANPDVFDVYRESTGHLAFGAGPHMCAGRWAAQCSVGQVALPMLFSRLQGLIASDPAGARFSGWTFRGIESLPVQWDSATRSASRTYTSAREVVVVGKRVEAEGVCSVSLRPIADDAAWLPGTHVTIGLPNGLERQYSLCGPPTDNHWRIGVLAEPTSRGGSGYIHTQLRVGDRLPVLGLRNNFPLIAARRYRFVAGGIGITPILPMIAHAEAKGADWSLLYLGRIRRRMAFLAELEHYGDRVTVWPSDEYGTLNLRDHLVELDSTLVYACGPEKLVDALEVLSADWPESTLHVERFVARTVDLPSNPFRIRLARSGHVLEVPSDKTIVDVLDDAGVSVATSCLEGTCRTCETRVVAGTPCHRDSALTAEERIAGDSVLVCVSRAKTEELTLDL